jgi:hypothetical protein
MNMYVQIQDLKVWEEEEKFLLDEYLVKEDENKEISLYFEQENCEGYSCDKFITLQEVLEDTRYEVAGFIIYTHEGQKNIQWEHIK